MATLFLQGQFYDELSEEELLAQSISPDTPMGSYKTNTKKRRVHFMYQVTMINDGEPDDPTVLATPQQSSITLTKEGSHTDSRASSDYNKNLSKRRAKETVSYLISKGINVDRIYGVSYGEEKLTNECKDGQACSEEKHQKNQRSEFIVID